MNQYSRHYFHPVFWLMILFISAGCAAKKPPELIWPLPPEEPRIKFIKTIRSSADVERKGFWKKLQEQIVGGGSSAMLSKPYAVHMDREGRLFVTDSAYAGVLIFDTKKETFRLIGLEGPGVLSKPMGVTTDATGRIYVTDTIQNRVVIYDHEGQFLLGIGKKGRFEQPIGIAVNDALDRVYVVDTKKHRISVFDSNNGEFLFEIGSRGTGDGLFNWPTNLVIDGGGKLFVMDTFNFRVQVFDPEGKFLRKFGAIGTAPGHFAKPKGIAIDSEGHVYVVDAAFNNIQIFDDQGRLLLFFGGFGSRSGMLWLPAGMAIDQEDKIYVADQYNHRINVYQFMGENYKAKAEAAASR